MSRKQLEAALATARASVAALEATVTTLEAALESAGEHDPSTELLDLKAVKAEYDIGPDGLKAAAARGELDLHPVGERDKLYVERGELERYRRSRKYKPKQRRPVADLEAWKAEAKRSIEGGS
jgi:multidrug resistance efflux pump